MCLNGSQGKIDRKEEVELLVEYRVNLEKMAKLGVNDLDGSKYVARRNTSSIESQMFIQI